MNINERVEKVEKRIGRGEDRTTVIEQAIIQMRDLLISHDERLEDYLRYIRESREDFDFKMNALIQAQMDNEAGIRELKESSTQQRESITELRESSTQQRESIAELRASTIELRESSTQQRESITGLRELTKDLRIASQGQLNRIEKLENN